MIQMNKYYIYLKLYTASGSEYYSTALFSSSYHPNEQQKIKIDALQNLNILKSDYVFAVKKSEHLKNISLIKTSRKISSGDCFKLYTGMIESFEILNVMSVEVYEKLKNK